MRRVLLKMAREASLFGQNVPAGLQTPYVLRYTEIPEFKISLIPIIILRLSLSLFNPNLDLSMLRQSILDVAAMHQDTSEDREVVAEKLESIFKVRNEWTELESLL